MVVKIRIMKPVASPRPLRGNILCGCDQAYDPWPAPPLSSPAVAWWGPARGAVTFELPQAGPSTGTSGTDWWPDPVSGGRFRGRGVVPRRLVLLQGPM